MKKYLAIVLAISLSVMLALTTLYCGGGGGGDGTSGGGNNIDDAVAEVNLGPDTILVTKSIDAAGETIQGPKGSPIEEVSVYIPPDALKEDTEITIGYNDGTVKPILGTFGGTILTIDMEGSNQFYEPVEVTMPYPGGETIPIPYYIDDQGKLHLMEIASIDPIAGKFSFITFHTSQFATVLETIIPGWREGKFDSGFRPKPDGFSIGNRGTTYNAEGECVGFTAFSQWYYKHHKGTKGDLYPRFMPMVKNYRIGQQIIVTRAYESHQRMFNYYKFDLMAGLLLNDLETYFVIRNVIANTKQPVMIHLQNSLPDAIINWGIHAHSVLAYAVDSGKMLIYDPNSPGGYLKPFIEIPAGSDRFDPYGEFSLIFYYGDGSRILNEAFEHILKDAEANFNSSNQAQIKITSHTNNANVTEEFQTLRGHIDSGDILIEELEIVLNGVGLEPIDIPVSGDWDITLNLESGDNYIGFVTKGYSWGVGMIPIPHDHFPRFKLVYNVGLPATYSGSGTYYHSQTLSWGEKGYILCASSPEWSITLNADGTLESYVTITKVAGHSSTGRALCADRPDATPTKKLGTHANGHFSIDYGSLCGENKLTGTYDENNIVSESWSCEADYPSSTVLGGTVHSVRSHFFNLSKSN